VIDAPRRSCHSPQAIKAVAALARVDRFPQRPFFQKVGFLQIGRPAQALRLSFCKFSCSHPANLLGQAHLNHVSPFASFRQTQSAFSRPPPHSLARRRVAEARPTRQLVNRQLQPRSSGRGVFPVSAEIFVSRSSYRFQEEARFIPPWITLLKVCPAVAEEVALLTEEQTRIYEENIK
jgi:hypothetical protein